VRRTTSRLFQHAFLQSAAADYSSCEYQAYLRRLRQTDVKAGHFERKVQALEQDRDQWESKYEEMAKKYATVQKELEDFQAEIGNI
jgi:peptidoglycan hydrolase CwlO-like protein